MVVNFESVEDLSQLLINPRNSVIYSLLFGLFSRVMEIIFFLFDTITDCVRIQNNKKETNGILRKTPPLSLTSDFWINEIMWHDIYTQEKRFNS